jgi:hypothetical protein
MDTPKKALLNTASHFSNMTAMVSVPTKPLIAPIPTGAMN